MLVVTGTVLSVDTESVDYCVAAGVVAFGVATVGVVDAAGVEAVDAVSAVAARPT